MIKKTLAVTLLLFIIFSILIVIPPFSIKVWQTQQHENIVKAEEFIYANNYKNIIIGTSLSAELTMDSLKDFYNLGFKGQSIYDGLTILSKVKKTPTNIFIETNMLLRDQNSNFTETLFDPILYPFKSYLSPLRDGYEPLAHLGQFVSFGVTPFIFNIKSSLAHLRAKLKHHPIAQKKSEEALIESDFFKEQVKIYSLKPSDSLLNIKLDELENLIIPLKKRGINIIFFEMPINKYLCNLLLPETIRDAFKRRFNPEKYTYLKSADCANFNTSDGFHLNKQESQVYTGFFKKEASHLSNSL